MPSEVRKLRQIEEENAKLKRLTANLSRHTACAPWSYVEPATAVA